jgi:hypothetical protein
MNNKFDQIKLKITNIYYHLLKLLKKSNTIFLVNDKNCLWDDIYFGYYTRYYFTYG